MSGNSEFEAAGVAQGRTAPWAGNPVSSQRSSEFFSLGETFPPIPGKLVKKIQAEEYVDLSELLPDNVELLRRAEAEPSTQVQGQRQLRRVSTLSTWVQCFATYAAVLAEAHPYRMRDLLAYLRLIVREAQCHEGDGWRSYDILFRKLAAMNTSIKWGAPLPSLYSTSFTSSRPSQTLCELCLKGDHKSGECALSPAISAVSFLSQERLVQLGLQSLASLPRASQVRDSRTASTGFADRPVCKRWNFGSAGCKGYPACTYRHACLKCGRRSHRAIDCRERETAPAAAGEVQATANPSNNAPSARRD